MEERRPTVFVVDDDVRFLMAVTRLLRAARLTVVAFESAERFLAEHDSSIPGCLVLDLAMPDIDGLAVQEALVKAGSDRQIVFLTGRGDVPTTARAMKRGAVDFLTKPVEDAVLLDAVEAAIARDAEGRSEHRDLADLRDRWQELTPREHEVARHVIAGRLNKQIARDLGVVERTVKYHRSHVMKKLGVNSAAAVARLAERLGIEPLQPPRSPGQIS